MIPSAFHFIWLGGPLPEWAAENIGTFRSWNPSWPVRLWTDDGLLRPEYRQTWRLCKPNSSQQGDLLRFSVLQLEPGWYFDCDCRAFAPMERIIDGLADDRRIVIPNYGDYPGTRMTSTWMMGSPDGADWTRINRHVEGWNHQVSYLTFSNTMTEAMYDDFQTVSWRLTNSGANVLMDATRPPSVVIGHGFRPR